MDERLKFIEEVIAINNKEISAINKKASESRKRMDDEDRRKMSSLQYINRDLGKAKFRIVQTLVQTSLGRKLEIIGLEKLNHDIEYYKSMFPATFLTLERIHENLWEDFKRNDGNTGLFGMSVSSEWPDKCYGFEFVGFAFGEIRYKYVGICKS